MVGLRKEQTSAIIFLQPTAQREDMHFETLQPCVYNMSYTASYPAQCIAGAGAYVISGVLFTIHSK